MNDRPENMAFLKQVTQDPSLNLRGGDRDRELLTSISISDRPITIGRDPHCEVAIDLELYGSVSRRHAEIRPIMSSPNPISAICYGWEICDLQSANGTFVNEQRLYGCQILRHGDRIALSKDGPNFIFELARHPAQDPADSDTEIDTGTFNAPRSQITKITLTQLLPIFSTHNKPWQKSYFLTGLATVGFVVMMFAFLGQPKLFNLTVSIYISLAAYYFIYQLCRKSKPWWIILGTALFTAAILRTPVLNLFIWFFYKVLPGNAPTGQTNLLSILVSTFFGAGLMEELLKALPLFLLWFMGLGFSKQWRSLVGISEPLDGILLGAASAVGFTLTETLGLYVPNIIQSVASQAGMTGTAELTGLQLLIPRILGSVAGHMAYSGYFGYFIGLSVLKPSRRWQILTIGYLSAALLHALWNTSALINFWLLAIVGCISYAFLIASISKAHSLSQRENTQRL